MKWTVARFPSGSWTTGGEPSNPDYKDCEVFVIEAPDGKQQQNEHKQSALGKGEMKD